ncbi:MAG: transporter substrate-binding domain-containing protein [Desulfobacterales bacterium]
MSAALSLLFLSWTVAAQAALELPIPLTKQERAWLSAHRDITLVYTDLYEPQLIVNLDGSYSGMLVDFLDALNKRLGTQIKLHIDTVPGLLARATSKEVDGILEVHPAYADKLGLLPTKGYLTAYPTIFGRGNVSFESPSDFAGKKVAIVDKIFFSDQLIRQYGQQASVLKVKDTMEGLRLVSEGDADLFVGVSFNTYLIMKYQLFDLVSKYTFFDSPAKFGMAIRPDWPDLVSILNKGIDSFAQHEIDAIVAKWIHHSPTMETIAFTPQEHAWIAQDRRVRVRVGNYPPNAFWKGDKPVGIAIDFLREVSKRSGVTMDFVVSTQSFGEALDGLIRHSGPDLLPSIQSTPEREKHFLFTDAYLTHPKFIFTRDDAPFVSTIEDLFGKTVAVERDYAIKKLLEKRYPQIKLKSLDTSNSALTAVSSGQAFAYIGPIRPTGVQINRYGFTNLKAAAPSSLPDNVVRMAMRNDWPELRSIINKVFSSIPDEEKNEIINRWTPITFEHGIHASDLVKWALGITGGVLIILGAFLLWNRSLAGRVRQRTRELEATTENLETEIAKKTRAEISLQESRRYTDKLIETANVMIVGLDAEGKVNVFNPAAEKITGYTLSELQGKNWFELITPKERYPQIHAEFSRLMTGGLPKLFENPILTKIGDERVISWCNNEIADDDRITGTLSFGIDITDKKKAEGELAESELRFRSLVEQSPFSIQLFAPNGILIQVNEAWQALWGISDETLPELLGSYNVLEDEEGRKLGLLPFIQKAFNGENVVLPIVEHSSANTLANMAIDGPGGRKAVVQSRFYPVKNRNGDIVTVVSIEEDITQRKKDEEKIQQHQQRLKALAAQLTLAEEQERRRIAADLHDHVGHSLALARMQLDGLQDSATGLERNIIVKDISNIMLQALQQTRSLIFTLSSPLMNEIGLGAAIAEWLEEQIEKRYGIKTQFSDTIAKEHRKTLDENVRALLFRNVRELLTNVIKHARATTVFVRLKENGSEIQILIEDDGVGFDHDLLKKQSTSTNGFGLFSIQERMADLGGTMDIRSAPGEGCRVTLTVPVEEWSIGGRE